MKKRGDGLRRKCKHKLNPYVQESRTDDSDVESVECKIKKLNQHKHLKNNSSSEENIQNSDSESDTEKSKKQKEKKSKDKCKPFSDTSYDTASSSNESSETDDDTSPASPSKKKRHVFCHKKPKIEDILQKKALKPKRRKSLNLKWRLPCLIGHR